MWRMYIYRAQFISCKDTHIRIVEIFEIVSPPGNQQRVLCGIILQKI